MEEDTPASLTRLPDVSPPERVTKKLEAEGPAAQLIHRSGSSVFRMSSGRLTADAARAAGVKPTDVVTYEVVGRGGECQEFLVHKTDHGFSLIRVSKAMRSALEGKGAPKKRPAEEAERPAKRPREVHEKVVAQAAKMSLTTVTKKARTEARTLIRRIEEVLDVVEQRATPLGAFSALEDLAQSWVDEGITEDSFNSSYKRRAAARFLELVRDLLADAAAARAAKAARAAERKAAAGGD